MDQAAALASIYHEGLPKPADGSTHTKAELEALRPYAIIWTDPDGGYATQSDSAPSSAGGFVSAGSLLVEIERNSTDGAEDEPTSAANLDWRNAVGKIIDDLCDLSGTESYMILESITLDHGPYWNDRASAETHGIYQGVRLAVRWGGI